MHVVDPDHTLSGQGLCFICEKAIDHPKEKAIRTGHDFDPLFHTPLAGDKFVCQSCADTMAQVLGYVSPDQAEQLKESARFAELRFAELQELAANFGSGLPARPSVEAVTVKQKEKHGSKA
jgi:hypothetical protein